MLINISITSLLIRVFSVFLNKSRVKYIYSFSLTYCKQYNPLTNIASNTIKLLLLFPFLENPFPIKTFLNLWCTCTRLNGKDVWRDAYLRIYGREAIKYEVWIMVIVVIQYPKGVICYRQYSENYSETPAFYICNTLVKVKFNWGNIGISNRWPIAI